ncbi:hypothetical protein M011DRAFT_331330 [Sporormia fimetaria CBS 119925]|uniref:Uncharacterized protein n=1 Tax=Sporormia fimetaria CBS 119925 TaxID=1340428 RepID=A0A6A6UW30_9PLEO|nr:hypothetical protein M011DRAFT_331330 [Sporormia fimetaria CBS 119925]
MTDFISYFRICRDQNLFPKSDSLVICAISRGEIALPDQQRIICMKLEAEGLTVDTSNNYDVRRDPRYQPSPDSGSIFMDGSGSTIQVYVEDRLVKTISKGSIQPSGTSATASTMRTLTPATSTSGYSSQLRQCGLSRQPRRPQDTQSQLPQCGLFPRPRRPQDTQSQLRQCGLSRRPRPFQQIRQTSLPIQNGTASSMSQRATLLTYGRGRSKEAVGSRTSGSITLPR